MKMSTKRLAYQGLLAAVILLATYLIKVPIPATGGYVHPGDGFIFLAVLLLGKDAVLSAAVGSALSDLIGGYTAYILPTFLIKGLMAVVALAVCKKENKVRCAVGFVLAEVVMVLGYFAFEGFMYGWVAAWAAVGPNCVQGISGVVFGMAFATVLPSINKRIKR